MPSIQDPVDATFGAQIRKGYGCFLSTKTGARYLECGTGTLVKVDS